MVGSYLLEWKTELAGSMVETGQKIEPDKLFTALIARLDILMVIIYNSINIFIV